MTGNILIVDDESASLKLLRDILAAEGYQTRPFASGEMALRSVMAEPPELILLDVRMPGMDGFELCRRIREDGPVVKHIPVIFISGATETEDKVRAFRAGGVDYITKPFQKDEVIARVQTHVALHRSRLDLMQAEMALRKSEQNLKIAHAVADLGHWEMDAQSGEITWSEQTGRILGLAPQAASPSYDAFLNAAHPDDRKRLARCIEGVRQGAAFDIEYRVVLPDGRTRVVHGKGALVNFSAADRHPEIVGTAQGITKMIGVVQDITERKRIEAELREMAAGLEATVDERTRRLRRLAAQLTMTEERERRMLARDLHDNLGQLLAVIRIKLDLLTRDSRQAEIDRIKELVDQAEQSARSITLELSPPILHKLGLLPALKWLADEMARVYGIAVQVEGESGGIEPGQEIQAVLYRAARELLINVAKHAGVSSARVTCHGGAGGLALVVSDEGRGFDKSEHGGGLKGHRSFGLSSIHERIVNLGGTMEIDSSPGDGTTVTLIVPCSGEEKGTGDDPHDSGR